MDIFFGAYPKYVHIGNHFNQYVLNFTFYIWLKIRQKPELLRPLMTLKIILYIHFNMFKIPQIEISPPKYPILYNL